MATKIVGDADAPSAGSPGSRAPFSPVELLRALDGWLAETGHDGGHPWRESIAKTLEAHRAAHARRPDAFHVLADDAFNLAAVIRAIGSRAETTRPEHTITTEENRIEIARALRVAYQLAEALGSKAADLAEVAHG